MRKLQPLPRKLSTLLPLALSPQGGQQLITLNQRYKHNKLKTEMLTIENEFIESEGE